MASYLWWLLGYKDEVKTALNAKALEHGSELTLETAGLNFEQNATVEDLLEDDGDKPSPCNNSEDKEQSKYKVMTGEVRKLMLKQPKDIRSFQIRNLESYINDKTDFEYIKTHISKAQLRYWNPISVLDCDNSHVQQFGDGYLKNLIKAFKNLNSSVSDVEIIFGYYLVNDGFIIDIFTIYKELDSDRIRISYERILKDYIEGSDQKPFSTYRRVFSKEKDETILTVRNVEILKTKLILSSLLHIRTYRNNHDVFDVFVDRNI